MKYREGLVFLVTTFFSFMSVFYLGRIIWLFYRCSIIPGGCEMEGLEFLGLVPIFVFMTVFSFLWFFSYKKIILWAILILSIMFFSFSLFIFILNIDNITFVNILSTVFDIRERVGFEHIIPLSILFGFSTIFSIILFFLPDRSQVGTY